MKPLPAKLLTKILKQNGFSLARQKGSHSIWKHAQSNATVIVPLHGGNQPIPMGTFMAIVKQSKLSRNVFQ